MGRHIQVSRGHQVVIEDNEIINPHLGGGFGGFGIRILGGKEILIRRNRITAELSAYPSGEISTFTPIVTMHTTGRSSNRLPARELTIEDNKISLPHAAGYIGIYIHYGAHFVIRGNVVEGCHEGIRFRNAERDLQIRDVRVENNVFCNSFRWSVKAGSPVGKDNDGLPPVGLVFKDNQFCRVDNDRKDQFFFAMPGAEARFEGNNERMIGENACTGALARDAGPSNP
jgi:hypothetical protein